MRWLTLQLLLALSIASGAHAQTQEFDFHYRPEWRRWGAWDYAGTTAVVAAYYAVELGLDGPRGAAWRGALPVFDRAARELVVAHTRSQREQADQISDWLWRVSIAYPVLDAAVTPLVRGGDFESSWRLTLINVQSFMVASLLLRIPHKLIGRGRPLTVGCENDPEYSDICTSKQRFVSFYGGHLTVAMTGAGLACAHHLHGELYGGGLPDALACGSALGVATAVGYFRMRGDNHWLSDQLLASIVGFASGYLLPTLLYYHPFWGGRPKRVAADSSDRTRIALLPMLSPDMLGAGLFVMN